MAPPRWSWLALPLLAAAVAGASASAVACPAADSPLAGAATPALTSLCPESCETGGVCVYYPPGFQDDCVTTHDRTCVVGGACAFACLAGTGGTAEPPGWLLTIYDAPQVLEDVARTNADMAVEFTQYRSVTINASLVTQWIGSYTFPTEDFSLFITGNEPAANMAIDEVAFYHDDMPLRPGDVVPFAFPPTFFEDVRGFGTLRLENVKFPALRKASPELAFPRLAELFLRNTMLTSFPFANASFPALEDLDLSVNTITEIVPSMIPGSVRFLNVSYNAITRVDKDAMPKNLTVLDVGVNSVKALADGTLPVSLEKLYLTENLLTEIPADVAKMTALTTLYLDDNSLNEIPDGAIPSRRLEALNLGNCSLTAVPKVLGSMAQLKELWLDRNDLGRDSDFSELPKSLEMLSLSDCQLQQIPVGLKNLPSLNKLILDNNPKAIANFSTLPKQLEKLSLNDNGLDEIPADIKGLSLSAFRADNNPLRKIAPGSLPRSLVSLEMSNTTFRKLPEGTLPDKLTELRMSDCAMEELPGDITRLRQLVRVKMSGCRIQKLDMGAQLVSVALMTFSDNRITSFSGSFPTLERLELRNNALTTFSDVKADGVKWVDLSGNNLTLVPDSIFQMDKLQLLNLTGNPIREFRPTSEQLAFLRRIEMIALDQKMFTSDCDPSARVKLNEYSVCPQVEAARTAPASRSWKWLVPLNVALVLVLALLVYTFWRRRKLQKQRQEDLAAEQASLAKQQQEQTTVSVWADAALLRDRIDEDLVDRKRLLGSGMFGDVWLATYKGEKVALKQLKQSGSASGGTLDREAIRDFVHEIKLLQSLSHPSVVSFVGVVWTKESDLGMVTEYMAGGDLRSYLDHHPKIYAGWTTQMVRIALQITEAIVYLHSLDPVVIHRDLKSRNVLLDTAMRAKLSDFGVSRYKLDDDTMTAGVGTVRWVAPEVLAGQRYDESADIYSLGVIFSEIDTHKLPFEGLTDESGGELLSDSAIAGMVVTGALQVGASKSCPSEIRSLVHKCTMFDATKRPSAGDVAYELRAMLEGSSASTATSNSTGTTSSNGIFRNSNSPVGTHRTAL